MNDIAHTGKSQASAMDIHSKIECQFLQRYAHYVVVDEMDQILTPSYVHMWHVLDHKRVSQEQYISYKTQQINNQNSEANVFFALKGFTFNKFSNMFDSLLDRYNVYTKDDYFRSIRTVQDGSHKRQQFLSFQPQSFNQDQQSQNQLNCFELFSNKLAQDQSEVLHGEVVILDTLIKCPSQRTKTLAYSIKQKVDGLFNSQKIQHQIIESEYLPYLRDYKYPTITLIILYNGDVNHDFHKTLQMNQIRINQHTYDLKIKVYFISKQALFSHFRESNQQQKIECITDKVVTFYDMNRIRQRRAKILKDIQNIKNQNSNIVKKRKKKKLWTWSIAGGVCIIAGILLWKKKQISLKQLLEVASKL